MPPPFLTLHFGEKNNKCCHVTEIYLTLRRLLLFIPHFQISRYAASFFVSIICPVTFYKIFCLKFAKLAFGKC